MSEFVVHLSDRSIPLVYNYPPGREPVLTIENYLKWYCLYRVDPSGKVTKIAFPDMGNHAELGEPYGDHVPNPAHVARYVKKHNLYMDQNAWNMIVGRWVTETMERDGFDYP